MTDATLNRAIAEAERFLRTAKAVKQAVSPHPSKQSGACKRASMDLTRALADLRRSA